MCKLIFWCTFSFVLAPSVVLLMIVSSLTSLFYTTKMYLFNARLLFLCTYFMNTYFLSLRTPTTNSYPSLNVSFHSVPRHSIYDNIHFPLFLSPSLLLPPRRKHMVMQRRIAPLIRARVVSRDRRRIPRFQTRQQLRHHHLLSPR